MKKILFDTDILIELLRGNAAVYADLTKLAKDRALLAYTAVTEAELFHGLRGEKEESALTHTLSVFQCVDIGKEAGREAGRYLKKYAKSHGLDTADALIAATAKINQLSLCTFNWKHYPMTDIEKYVLDRRIRD